MSENNYIKYTDMNKTICNWSLSTALPEQAKKADSNYQLTTIEGNKYNNNGIANSGSLNVSVPLENKKNGVRINTIFQGTQVKDGDPVDLSTNFGISSGEVNVTYDPTLGNSNMQYSFNNAPNNDGEKQKPLIGGGFNIANGQNSSKCIFLQKGFDSENTKVLNYSQTEYDGGSSKTIGLAITDKDAKSCPTNITNLSYTKNSGASSSQVFGIEIQKLARNRADNDRSYSLTYTKDRNNSKNNKLGLNISGTL